MKFFAIGDSSPHNTLLKYEGLQLAEASFREKLQVCGSIGACASCIAAAICSLFLAWNVKYGSEDGGVYTAKL